MALVYKESSHALELSFQAVRRKFGFPCGSVVKNLLANAGDTCSIPGSEELKEKEMATHSSILTWENPVDRRAWRDTVHGVAKESDTT